MLKDWLPSMTAASAPELSLFLRSFADDDSGGWSHIFNQARAADVTGVDRLMVPDHVVFGENIDAYGDPKLGGRIGAKQPTGVDGHYLDPLTTLAVVAGITTRVRLRTQILLAALRRPIVLAKVASTLDVLSNGRLDLGVGVGWQREEFEAASVPFEKRGRMLDHTLEVCQILWREQRASYSSSELSFENLHQMPKPLQPGGVPIWVGGSIRDTVVRRIVRHGIGWIPWGTDIPGIIESAPKMREAISKAGGDGDALKIVGHLPSVMGDDGKLDIPRTMDALAPFIAAGVTDFFAPLMLPNEQAAAEDFLHGLVSAFRTAVGRPLA